MECIKGKVYKWMLGIASLFTLLTVTCAVSVAETLGECTYWDGGYCVSKLTSEIADLVRADFGEPNTVEGAKYFQRLESIWNILIEKNLAMKEDMDRAFVEADKATGVKIGGANLIVLSAWTLHQMVYKNIITKDDAQKILSGAR